MRKSIIKYLLYFLTVLIILFFSLDIHKLDSQRLRPENQVFDVEGYVENVWQNHLPDRMEEAIEVKDLLRSLNENPDETFENHSFKLGISNTHYFYIKADGIIDAVGDESVTVSVNDHTDLELETVFIFGNAVRDGSGLVNIDDFLNMMDFNMVAVYLNRRIKSEVVDPFRKIVKKGMKVNLIGAVEISRIDMHLDPLKVIPVKIELDYGEN